MKKLMLLGGSRYLLPYIRAAHQMGLYVVTCDYLPDNYAHRFSDEYANVSIIDKEAVLKKAEQLQIDGIMSPATDPGVVTAAYTAEKMGLRGVPYQSAVILQNKNLFRQFLKDNNFNVPSFASFTSEKDALDHADEYAYPVIVKPVDSAGSKGVTRVNDKNNLAAAVRQAFEHSISKKIIIEEFITQQGSSSDTDSFSVNDKLVFCSFNRQHFDASASNPYAPEAYSWPSSMPIQTQNELRNEIQRVISLLHLGTSLYNIETRLSVNGKAYIMELSPRAGGNRLAEVLKYACGTDLVTNAVRAAMGMQVDEMKDPVYHGAWSEYILHGKEEGTFRRLVIDPSFREKHVREEDLWVKEGDHIYPFTGANRAIGTLILQFDSQDEAEDALCHPDDWMHIEMK